jgi:hypothetical protein
MDACTKAFEASAKSSQLYNYSQKGEDYFTTYGKNMSYSVLGESSTMVIGGTAFLVKTYRTKNAEFKLPTLGVCDSLSTKVGIDNYSVNLKWNLPW